MSEPKELQSGGGTGGVAAAQDLRFVEDRRACPPGLPFQVEDLLLIVVGAHIKAEIADRPLAYRLQRLVRAWQAATLEEGDQVLLPVVCTDAWFLSESDLMRQPCIAIGEAGHNAAVAYYATRLPRAYVVDNHCAVHCDQEFIDGSVCLWGAHPDGTEAAVEVFVARHLDAYLRATHL